MVCEAMKKDPANKPGESARAIDTFRKDYTACGRWEQAANALQKHQIKALSDGFDYFGECSCMFAFLAGFAPEMPLGVANDIVVKMVEERRGIA